METQLSWRERSMSQVQVLPFPLIPWGPSLGQHLRQGKLAGYRNQTRNRLNLPRDSWDVVQFG